ncbi:hypothetical protein [Pseudogemmobacter humi]|uniref:Uncharacterized protein n=1 Tax=Pseudogemmobacter humi TaxID=2483812 RepID=A0A3P5WS24_9RHOB|nr:hypothetical protein [Pseudogemmobacter humi]VDC24365.1 hypothetical protein XINFAN_01200 [Pseudogemmobacter humi]
MSLLQKAVRRGRLELALQAASTLLEIAPDRFWRRAGVIAFEDIGVADLPTAGIVTVALEGKRFRQRLGGGWVVAAAITTRMAISPRNRAADDLFCLLESWPGLADNRQRLENLPIPRLRLIALTTEHLPLRALALRMIFSDRRLDLPRRGSTDIGFDVLDELGVAPTTFAVTREGYRRTGEMLAPLVALLTLENGLRDKMQDDPLPPETMIGPLPGWALDIFTREGRAALAKIFQIDAGIRKWATDALPAAGRVEMLAQALFRVESGMCLQRQDGPTGERLRELMERECMGLSPDQADEVLALMRGAIPLLNTARRNVLGGQSHA